MISLDLLHPSGQATYFNIQHAKTGQVLDANDNSDSYLEPSNGGWYQLWRWQNNYFTNFETGQVLDSDSSGNVYTNSNNGGSYQKWTQVVNNGDSKIQNQGTNRFLDGDDQAHMLTSPSDKLKYPVWNFNNG